MNQELLTIINRLNGVSGLLNGITNDLIELLERMVDADEL